ncbi:MAG: thioredoxin family protein [Gemmatimonadales bacterium]|nr:thioredoxin family protein [Gemmatimonadales bacterium]
MTDTLDFEQLWTEAISFDEFVAAATKHQALWSGVYRTAQIPNWALEAVPAGTNRNFLVIAEDWCGDASNTVPVVAKLADHVAGLNLKIIRRDEHPEVMDRYLTNGSRSIPIVIALDAGFQELGHWGPRPEELQRFVMEHRSIVPKGELYPQVRRWYAKDRGQAILKEVLQAGGLPVASSA